MKLRVFLAFSAIFLLLTPAFSQKDFFSTDMVHEIKVNFRESNWRDILDSFKLNNRGLLLASVSIDGVSYDSVGVGYRGTHSFQVGNKRNPYSLDLNVVRPGQNHQGLSTIKLSHALRDPSMVREVLGFEIARKYMPASRAAYAGLTINGEWIGLFVTLEAVNKEFLTRNLGNSEGALIKCGINDELMTPPAPDCKKNLYGSLEYEENPECLKNNFEVSDPAAWKDLHELIRILNKEPDKIATVLDVDRALWMLAFNNALLNLSSYSGWKSMNYYLYRMPNGKFTPIIWDLNLCFGSFKNINGKSDLSNDQMANLDVLLHSGNQLKPLISRLLKNPEYKKIYFSHYQAIYNEVLKSGWYVKRARELQTMISKVRQTDPHNEYNFDQFKSSISKTIGEKTKIPGVFEIMDKRINYLKRNSNILSLPPKISDIKFKKRASLSDVKVDKFILTAKVDGKPMAVKLFYRFDPAKEYQVVFLKDDGKLEDSKAQDGKFTGVIQPSEGDTVMYYYITAENYGALSFEPAMYFVKPMQTSLADLNK